MARDQPISNYEGDEVDHDDGMEMVMVLVLAVVLMETPEGGWRRPPEVIPATFHPSDLLRRQPSVSLFLVLCFSATPLWKTSGNYFYSRFYVTRKLREEGSTQTGPRGPKWVVPHGLVL